MRKKRMRETHAQGDSIKKGLLLHPACKMNAYQRHRHHCHCHRRHRHRHHHRYSLSSHRFWRTADRKGWSRRTRKGRYSSRHRCWTLALKQTWRYLCWKAQRRLRQSRSTRPCGWANARVGIRLRNMWRSSRQTAKVEREKWEGEGRGCELRVGAPQRAVHNIRVRGKRNAPKPVPCIASIASSRCPPSHTERNSSPPEQRPRPPPQPDASPRPCLPQKKKKHERVVRELTAVFPSFLLFFPKGSKMASKTGAGAGASSGAAAGGGGGGGAGGENKTAAAYKNVIGGKLKLKGSAPAVNKKYE